MKEYFITKLTFREDENLIQDVFSYEYDGTGYANKNYS